MKRIGLDISVIVILAASACAPGPKTAPTPHCEVLVKQLPDGVEGLELRDGALWVKDGYTVVPEPSGMFTITRDSDGTAVTSGSCGCHGTEGTCETLLKGGIAVCEGTCSKCGLAVWVEGVRTEILLFSR